MNIQKVPILAAFVLSLFFVFSFLTPGSGQAETGTKSMKKSPACQEADKKAMKKLKKMTPEEVKELDRKLAEALTLFYDMEYARALPIFREISEKVETMDIMFWSATCAYRSGDVDSAIKKYKEMLDVDPNLHRARLELATAYYSSGKYNDARRELETVLDASPPEAVRMKLEKLIANIDKKTKKLFPSVRFSQGIQWDSNVNVAPDRDTIGVPIGGTLTLRGTQKEVDDWASVTNLSGNLLYDPGDHNGFMWNSTGSFYQTHNFDHHKFDFTNMRVSSGPWWAGKRSVFKLPVAYAKNIYEHDRLYDTFDVRPSYEYFFSKKFSLKGMFTYSRDRYHQDGDYGQDNHTYVYEINPNIYFNDRRDIISVYLSRERRNAKDNRYGYRGFNIAVSYFKRFSWDMEFFIRYKYTDLDYEDPAILWINDRKDDRNNIYAVLSQNFWKHYFASVYFNWIDNDSNTAVYDYNKMICGMSMGFKF